MRVFQQKGCKTWSVRFSINGRQYQKALGTKNKEAAYQKAREFVKEKRDEADGILTPKILRDAAQTPLIELLETWVSVGLSPDVKDKHRYYSKSRPAKIIQDCEWKYLRDVTAQDFEAWRTHQLMSEAYKHKTLNDYLSSLRSFFKWLEERGMLAKNPLTPVKLLRKQEADSLRAITPDELLELVTVAAPYRACLYKVAGFVGLRRRELKTLKWNRVYLDPTKPRIELDPSLSKNGKGGTLPLLPDARGALAELRAMAPDGVELVFYKGITQNQTLRKDMKKAGIPAFNERGMPMELRSFRRGLASMLSSCGVVPRVAMQLMRHGSMHLTYQVYTDENLLPMMEELKKVPILKSSLKSSPLAGKTCPNVSKDGKTNKSKSSQKLAANPVTKANVVVLSSGVQRCPDDKMADREGFEPSIPSLVYSLSRGALSTTQPPVLDGSLWTTGVVGTYSDEFVKW